MDSQPLAINITVCECTNRCYYCKRHLNPSSDSWFCDEFCKEFYWSGDDKKAEEAFMKSTCTLQEYYSWRISKMKEYATKKSLGLKDFESSSS